MARAVGGVIPPVLILAGSRGGTDPLAAHCGVADKALVEVAGTPMLARVVAALRDAGAERIIVSVSSPAVKQAALALDTEVIDAAAGPSLSTREVLELVGAPLLVTTADHALLEPAWVQHFVMDAPIRADVAALLARRPAIEAAAPGTRRTYLKFADGDWSGCNMFLLLTRRASAALDLWRRIEADRKRPWRIVRRLGPLLLVRYLLRRLTLEEAVARLGRQAGIVAAAVESPFGLAAVDVDKPADLELVERLLAPPSPRT